MRKLVGLYDEGSMRNEEGLTKKCYQLVRKRFQKKVRYYPPPSSFKCYNFIPSEARRGHPYITSRRGGFRQSVTS